MDVDQRSNGIGREEGLQVKSAQAMIWEARKDVQRYLRGGLVRLRVVRKRVSRDGSSREED